MSIDDPPFEPSRFTPLDAPSMPASPGMKGAWRCSAVSAFSSPLFLALPSWRATCFPVLLFLGTPPGLPV